MDFFNKLKKGDNILCKKSIEGIVEKNNYYKIRMTIHLTKRDLNSAIVIDEHLFVIDTKLSETIKEHCKDEEIPFVSDYFYTAQEIRKEKLNTLNKKL